MFHRAINTDAIRMGLKRTVLLLSLLAASTVASADERLPLVQPPGSGLSLSNSEVADGAHSQFSGEILVRGTLVAKWWPGEAGKEGNKPDYDFIPNSKSKAALPHYRGYLVRSVELLNGPEALRLAAGVELANRLAAGGVQQVRVTGEFVLDEYEVGVECDAPWAKARLVNVKSAESPVVSPIGTPSGC